MHLAQQATTSLMANEVQIDVRSIDEGRKNHLWSQLTPVVTPNSTLSAAETAQDSGLLDEGRLDDDIQDSETERASPSLPIPAMTPFLPWVCIDGTVLIWEGCDAMCSDRLVRTRSYHRDSVETPSPPPATALFRPSAPGSGIDRAHSILREAIRCLEVNCDVEE